MTVQNETDAQQSAAGLVPKKNDSVLKQIRKKVVTLQAHKRRQQ